MSLIDVLIAKYHHLNKASGLMRMIACVATVASISSCMEVNGKCVGSLFGCQEQPEKKTKIEPFPTVGKWHSMNASGAPESRYLFESFWTGAEVLVIGGRVAEDGDPGSYRGGGGLYDAKTDSWRPVNPPEEFSASLVPNARYLWSDDRLYVLARSDADTQEKLFASFDPKTSTWTKLATDGLPRRCTAIIWTGDRIQEACEQVEPFEENGQYLVSYDPKTNGWTRQVTTGFPKVSIAKCSVWTGSEWLIWAWIGSDRTGKRGRYAGYRLARGTTAWVAVATAPDVVAVADGAVCAWTGKELAVYGLRGGGAFYKPKSNTWRLMNARFGTDGALVWTGTKLIAVGNGRGAYLIYDPASDKIRQTPSRSDSFSDFSTAWAGDRLVVWGGLKLTKGKLEPTNVGAVLTLPP